MHLVDCVLESLDVDYAQADAIGKLAGNPWLTEGTRAYILKHISAIDSDTYRQQAILSLPQKPIDSCGYLGVTHQADGSGARITKVWPDSAAAKAGLEVGMTIVKFDGRPVRNQNELNTLIMERVPGAKVKIALKDGREIDVTLGMRPGARKAEAEARTEPAPGGTASPAEVDAFIRKLREGFSDDRWKRLESATGTRWLPVDRVGDVVALWSFDDDRLRAFRLCLKSVTNRRCSTEVLRRILGTFSHDDSRLEVVRAFASTLTDPHNGHVLEDAMTFGSGKEAVRTVLAEAARARREE
jgi:membrane-associated protease RseP (regulator of RpoE activity)